MPQKSFKPKILLDEGISPRHKLPRLNSRFDIKHIAQDLHKSGSKDAEVYKIACNQNRIIITYNDKDYYNLATKNKKSGVIGLSTNMTNEQIDNQLTALFTRKSVKNIYGKFTYLHVPIPKK